MTVERKNKILQILPLGISTATLIFVATLSYNTGKMNAEIRKDIETNRIHSSETRISIEKHKADKVNHTPLSEQIVTFVPRIELEGQFKSLSKQLDRIEDKIEKK